MLPPPISRPHLQLNISRMPVNSLSYSDDHQAVVILEFPKKREVRLQFRDLEVKRNPIKLLDNYAFLVKLIYAVPVIGTFWHAARMHTTYQQTDWARDIRSRCSQLIPVV